MNYKSKLMMSFLSTLFTVLPLFAHDLAASGGSAGGGGGSYKLPNGKMVTLPEFGVLIKDPPSPITTGKTYPRPPDYCPVPVEVQKEIEEIVLRIRKIVPSFSIPGNPTPERKKLICKPDVDPEKYEQIKKEYRVALEAFGYKLIDDIFVLPAHSEGGVTYIFPDFKKLTSVQQAKYFIHEAQMRDTTLPRVEALVYALKIDTLIEELAFPKVGATLDIFDILKRLAHLKVISQQDVFYQIMLMLVQEMNGEVPLHSLIEEPLVYAYGADRLKKRMKFDPSFVQELQIQKKLKNNYAEMLEGVEISFEGWQRDEYSKYRKEHNEILSTFCSEKSYTEAMRIIVNPRTLLPWYREEWTGVWRIVPTARIPVVAKCEADTLRTNGFLLLRAGPFISSLAPN